MKRGIQIGIVIFGTLTALILWWVWALVEAPYTRVTAEITAARDQPRGYPPVLVHAVLAGEDPSFLDDGRFVTAKRLLLACGRASLTNQLVRGLGFVDPRRPSKYAVRAILTSVLVDLTASKSGIVAAYLSSVRGQ